MILAIIITYIGYLDIKTGKTAHSQQKNSPVVAEKYHKIYFTSTALTKAIKRIIKF